MLLRQKPDKQGHIALHKGRIVANDYLQEYFVDDDEKFAPIEPFDLLLLIVGEFTSVGWHFYHSDTPNAFLNGDIHSKQYASSDNKCYRLQMSVYCLEQSTRNRQDSLKMSLEVWIQAAGVVLVHHKG